MKSKRCTAGRTRPHLVLRQHTLLRVFINKAWLGSIRQTRFGIAWAWRPLGLATCSVRLYYTAPYQFLVSMFRVPVLVPHLLDLGLASALLVCFQQILYDVPLPSNRRPVIHWLGLAWLGFITRHRTDFRYRCFVHLSSYTGLAWAGLESNCLLPINSTN